MPEAARAPDAAENSELQKASFNQLVDAGVYKKGFAHPEKRVAFFKSALSSALSLLHRDGTLKVLDGGCGTGAWLSVLHEVLTAEGRSSRLMGFDVSDGMVQVAQQELAGMAAERDIKVGDVLAAESFRFPDTDDGLDLIIVYDVIQQLPTNRQFEACALVARSLAPGGVAVIFDHDKHSLHGMRMGYRKFVTRRLGIPLVPDYYCNAHYPPLASFAKKLNDLNGFSADIKIDSEKKKQALIVKRSGD